MIQQGGLSVDARASDESTHAGLLSIDEFRALYDAHATDCQRVAQLIVRDLRLAEDVVQNVFVAVWNGTASFDPSRGPSKGWLLMVTHHKAVDLVRQNQRHQLLSLTDDLLEQFRAIDDVEDEALTFAHEAHVSRALAKLTDVQRQVIILAYFGGYTQVEIANLTGAALGTVKTRTLHGLRKLRANLDLITLATDEGWHHLSRPA
jgi:RNA polymerase sigma factor (sigma-70 family)